MISFEWDSRDMQVFRGGRIELALSRALRMAGNAALKEAQGASSLHVTSKKLISSDAVVKGLPLVFPSRKDAISSLVWEEKISGQAMPLAKFPYIQTGHGASVRVNATSGFKLISNAFTLRLNSGHVGIFQRKGKDRLPVKELWTTRISDSMSDPGAIDRAHASALGVFASTFEQGMAREIAKLKRKGDA